MAPQVVARQLHHKTFPLPSTTLRTFSASRNARNAFPKHTNWVESYFSRLRRMIGGQHHHVSHRYLFQYANHAAWLEDHRRRSNGENAHGLLGGALHHPVSRVWAGYWQRG